MAKSAALKSSSCSGVHSPVAWIDAFNVFNQAMNSVTPTLSIGSAANAICSITAAGINQGLIGDVMMFDQEVV